MNIEITNLINEINIKDIIKNVLYDIIYENINTNNQSPLRYPGGKSKACKVINDILINNFDIKKYKCIISPFFGGGSFEFYLQNNYNKKLIVNDKFSPLFNFWVQCKTNKSLLCSELRKIENVSKEDFQRYRNNIINENNKLQQAIYYFIINRCSFSGATLSGGFSNEASEKRFTKSSIDRIESLELKWVDFFGMDFAEFINNNYTSDTFMFLDPPYYLESKSRLYGNNGDLHEFFDHVKLFNILNNKKGWLMTYNNCDFIKKMYSNYNIVEVNWSYGMNKSKESSEIVIFSK